MQKKKNVQLNMTWALKTEMKRKANQKFELIDHCCFYDKQEKNISFSFVQCHWN